MSCSEKSGPSARLRRSATGARLPSSAAPIARPGGFRHRGKHGGVAERLRQIGQQSAARKQAARQPDSPGSRTLSRLGGHVDERRADARAEAGGERLAVVLHVHVERGILVGRALSQRRDGAFELLVVQREAAIRLPRDRPFECRRGVAAPERRQPFDRVVPADAPKPSASAMR